MIGLAKHLAGLTGPAEAFEAPFGADIQVLAEAAMHRGGVSAHIARDDRQAAAASRIARFFCPDLEQILIPAWDCLPYDRVSPAPAIAAKRCAHLSYLARRDTKTPLLVFTTVSALMQRLPPRPVMAEAAFELRAGQVLDMGQLSDWLRVNGYMRVPLVREAGDYAVRGGITDIFPPGQPNPVRLDLFGDTLETIRRFDAQSQKSLHDLPQVQFSPASEILFSDQTIEQFRKRYVEAFGPARDDSAHAAVLDQIRRQGMEHWLPLFYPQLETLFDYLGETVLIGLDSQVQAAAAARAEQTEDYYQSRQNAATGDIKPRILAPDQLYLSLEALETCLQAQVTVQFRTEDAPDGLGPVRVQASPGRNFGPERVQAAQKSKNKAPGQGNVFDAVVAHVSTLKAQCKPVVFAAWSDGSAERLQTVLSDHGLVAERATNWPQAKAASGPVIAALPLEAGFVGTDLAIISEQDILGDRMIRRRARASAESVIGEAAALALGDLIVHVDHGVGRYRGLRTIQVEGAARECLDLAYAGEDTVLLPVENIELISRYGSEASESVLDRLGGAAWQARKARAKKKIMDMAADLIRMAALRELRSAPRTDIPDGAFDEFCMRFPYEETEDQLQAVEAVLQDLSSGRPMDRLVCGDVGFGKTEVALRAAFVVLMSGMQVALVAPTTLLARQHMETVRQRFANWPIKLGRLSRLVPATEAAQTRKALADGTCDFVIGTHAVLSKSMSFKRLGLIIIDEEQRFGVRHKERLKDLRSDVHVLVLSATPIPRTLQMSLSSLRDLSAIATPPVDRLSVRTYVLEFDPLAIREALLRECYRGGQSYIVVPRIADLPGLETFLREQVPEASFLVAHGQMTPSQLDSIMTEFYDGQADVLLATNIVESGLDVPRANTLIVCRADRFGLGQLHQLRGRVGRSRLRAYAYLTTSPKHRLSEAAEQRLKILRSLDSLGAGFKLASHDLDMRGGGNLLGDAQSGHIREVGIELYQQMLKEAVESLQGEAESAASDWSPRIDLQVEALIPEDYVADLSVRLSLYRQFANLQSDAEQDGFAAELIDRFGPLPQPVVHLLEISRIKALCKQLGAGEITAGPKGVLMRFREDTPLDAEALLAFVAANGDQYRLRPDSGLIAFGVWSQAQARLKGVGQLLQTLAVELDVGGEA